MAIPVNTPVTYLTGMTLERGQPTIATTGGSVTSAAPAGSSTFYGNCLKVAAQYNQAASATYTVSKREHASESRLTGSNDRGLIAYVQLTFDFNTNSMKFMELRSGAAPGGADIDCSVGIGAGGRLHADGVASNQGTVTVASGSPFLLRVEHDRGGNDSFWVWRSGDSDWVLWHQKAATDLGAGFVQFGRGTAGTPFPNPTSGGITIDVMWWVSYDDFSLAANYTTNPAWDMHARMLYPTPTTITPTLELESGAIRGGVKARIQYEAGSSISGAATATAWQSLGSFNAGTLTLPVIGQTLTGLTPNTEYAIRWQVGNSSDEVIASGRTYTIKTMPAAGSREAWSIAPYACIDQASGDIHPLSAIKTLPQLLDPAAPAVRVVFAFGDRGEYESVSAAQYASNVAPTTFAGISVLQMELESDRYYQALSLVAGEHVMVDDHPYNDIDSSWDGDSTALSTVDTTFWSTSADTKADAWDRLTALYEQRFAQWMPNRAGAGKFYYHMDAGRTRFIFSDTRFESDIAGDVVWSSEQITWLTGLIASCPANIDRIRVITQGSIGPYTVQNDSPFSYDAAECKAFITSVQSALPTGKTVAFWYGDSHASPILHNKFEATAGDIDDSRFEYFGCLAPMQQSLFNNNDFTSLIPEANQINVRDLGTRGADEAIGKNGGNQPTAELAKYAYVVAYDAAGSERLIAWTGATCTTLKMDMSLPNLLVQVNGVYLPSGASPSVQVGTFTLSLTNNTDTPITLTLAYSHGLSGPATTGEIAARASEDVTVTAKRPVRRLLNRLNISAGTITLDDGVNDPTTLNVQVAGLRNRW